jgi:hypothetical protein
MSNALEDLIRKLGQADRKREAELDRMFPAARIERIKKKELRRFRETQDKKWQNWLEGVSR